LKPIKIDASRVPEDKQTEKDFIGLRDDMKAGMANPEIVKAVCTHEAGHMVFALQAKMIIHGLVGPEIHYKPSEACPFVGHAAHLEIEVPAGTPIEACARMLAAGGVASREVAKSSYAGDQEDFALYLGMCNELPQLADPKLRMSVWNDAKKIVEVYLREIAKTFFPELVQRLKADLDNVLDPQ
jgi:hypothetical protein